MNKTTLIKNLTFVNGNLVYDNGKFNKTHNGMNLSITTR